MIIDCVFCARYMNVGVLMISNTGHTHSSSMYDGDMEAGPGITTLLPPQIQCYRC